MIYELKFSMKTKQMTRSIFERSHHANADHTFSLAHTHTMSLCLSLFRESLSEPIKIPKCFQKKEDEKITKTTRVSSFFF